MQNNYRKICLSEASYFPAQQDNFRQFSSALIFGTFLSRKKYSINVLKKRKALDGSPLRDPAFATSFCLRQTGLQSGLKGRITIIPAFLFSHKFIIFI